ncbi:hypothetical protein [Salinarimonas ramus]|uniref:Uncharacterized protein n=1 Tax=Salinarimonas ramus TaxID=690164 RepID=A0A917Q460_9HYPH|nr:hypothetical protein [Salinarimonas ramus]GGK20174.1 hypothetical protein GCM10011322_03580 [Salinarimonas ramus]
MTRLVRLLAVAAFLPLVAPSALAQEPRRTPPPAGLYELGPHFCMCRAFARAFEPGERTCLRGEMAECTIVVNVMSWRPTGEPCPRT